MFAFIGRRLLEAVPVIVLSTIVVFLLLHLLPGDPAQTLAGPNAQPETIEALRRDMGLNEPLPVQYWIWVVHVVRGDLGTSTLSPAPVTYLIGLRVPATLWLAAAGMLVMIVVALPLGVLSALRAGTSFDWYVQIFNGAALAIPGFWLSILAILVFALWLGWFPPGGYVDPSREPIEGLRALLLPAVTLALNNGAALARQIRSSMLEVLEEDYVRTATAKGLSTRTVIVRHALRNAMLPVATLIGLQLGRLLGGAVITETVFTWPGVGTLLVTAIGQRDYAVVQATLLLFIGAFTIVNLLTDLSYAVLDPRIRLGRATTS